MIPPATVQKTKKSCGVQARIHMISLWSRRRLGRFFGAYKTNWLTDLIGSRKDHRRENRQGIAATIDAIGNLKDPQ